MSANWLSPNWLSPTHPATHGVSTLLRVGLGVVWLAAGLLKVGDPEGMVRSVRAFRILPESLVDPVAYAVPFIEIALGVLLIVGLAVRLGAVVSAVLFALYTAAIASAAARGLRIDCGCFSTGGDLTAEAPTHYTQEIVRDSLLLLAGAALAWRPDGYLSVDRLLSRPPAIALADGQSGEGVTHEDATGEDTAGEDRGAADRSLESLGSPAATRTPAPAPAREH